MIITKHIRLRSEKNASKSMSFYNGKYIPSDFEYYTVLKIPLQLIFNNIYIVKFNCQRTFNKLYK